MIQTLHTYNGYVNIIINQYKIKVLEICLQIYLDNSFSLICSSYLHPSQSNYESCTSTQENSAACLDHPKHCGIFHCIFLIVPLNNNIPRV